MNVAYLFYEEEKVVVPMVFYSEVIFRQLANFGHWDRKNNRFLLHHSLEKEQYRDIFAGCPYVIVKENCLVEINGFFWYQKPDISAEENIYGSGVLESEIKNDKNIQEFSGESLLAVSDELSKSDRASLASMIRPEEKFSPFWIERLKNELHSRKYSLKTIKSYLHYNSEFCRIIQKPVENILDYDFKKYLAYLDETKDLSSSSMNLAVSAIRFFYNNVMGKDIGREQYRPRQDKRLPSVLSRKEIEILLDAEQNPKHRLLLMLAYSSGLRVSEVVALKREHIDFNRKILLVYEGKGRKDRITILADRTASFLLDYCKNIKITGWLFPGQTNGHLRVRTAQNIFEKAINNACIKKNVSIHSLRHTFATHLLEGGTNIRYIQALLGHSNLRTTERYTHIARHNILRIRSPFDSDPGFE